MRKLLLGIVATVGLLSAPAAAQDVLDAQIADELPGLDLEESEFFPADGGAPAVAQKIFRSGNNVVTIAAQDFGPDQGIALASAFRAAADGYEVAYEELYVSEGVELGPPTALEHPDHVGVRVTERSFDNRTYFLAQYVEGTTGFQIVAVLEGNATFDTILAAQLDHSTGPRIDWQGNGGVLSADGTDDGSGPGVVIVISVLAAILAFAGWWFVTRAESDEPDAESGDA